MKTRQAFVSNSSSTSFIILGKLCKLKDYVEGEQFVAINRDSDPESLIYITPENVETLKGIEFEFLVFLVYDFAYLGDVSVVTEITGPVDAYGADFDYHTHWSAEELKERYEGYEY